MESSSFTILGLSHSFLSWTLLTPPLLWTIGHHWNCYFSHSEATGHVLSANISCTSWPGWSALLLDHLLKSVHCHEYSTLSMLYKYATSCNDGKQSSSLLTGLLPLIQFSLSWKVSEKPFWQILWALSHPMLSNVLMQLFNFIEKWHSFFQVNSMYQSFFVKAF